MNSNTLHASAIGRIWLLYKADMRTTAPYLISIVGMIFIGFFLYPRIHLILDFDYDTFLYYHPRSYDLSVQSYIVSMIGGLYGMWYINYRCFRSSPMSFALTPARLWEKVATMILMIVSLGIIAQGALFACFLLEVLMVPGITFAEHLEYINPYRDFHLIYDLADQEGVLHGYMTMGSVALFLSLGCYYCVTIIRNFSVGLIAGLLIPAFIAIGVPIIIMVHLFEEFYTPQYFIDQEDSWKILIYMYELYTLLLNLGVGYLLYKRLRTLPS